MIKYKIEENVVARKYVEIGEKTVIKCGAILGTGVKIGRNSYIGPGAIMLHMTPKGVSKPSVVGDRCFIGAGAILCPGVVLEDDVIIGAGAVVTKGVYRRGTYVGNPAKSMAEKREVTEVDENETLS